MKHYYLALLLLIALTSCETEKVKQKATPDRPVEYEYPITWRKVTNDPYMQGRLICLEVDEPATIANDMGITLVLNYGPSQHNNIEELRVYVAAHETREIIEDGTDTLLGHPAYYHITQGEFNGQQIMNLSMGTIIGPRHFVLLYYADKARYDKHYDEAREIIASIKLEE